MSDLLNWETDSIEAGPELARILGLARRVEPNEITIESISAAFRTREWGVDQDGAPRRNVLRPGQASGLIEAVECRGLLGPMRAGYGKTLISMLLATALRSQRPVLCIPAKLEDKTRREYAQYRLDWRVRLPEILTYETISHPNHQETLRKLAPDLLVLDEAHRARRDGARKRRIAAAIAEFTPVLAILSGTLITANILDYLEFAQWALAAKAPVPMDRATAERWAQALDRELDGLGRIGMGALSTIPGGFHSWLRGTRGVVPTPPGGPGDYTGSILLGRWTPPISPDLRATIDEVARTATRPDGEELGDWDLPECLCQLAQGFYSVWNPMPPEFWLRPRRCYTAYVRSVLDECIPGLDSPAVIATALEAAHPRVVPPAVDEGRELRRAWLAVKDTFTPNPVPVWLDASPLMAAIEHARTMGDGAGGCIIWTRDIAVGRMLEYLGVPYYGAGTNPEDAPPGQIIACSMQAHGEGKNLQRRHRALVLVPPASADPWEQLIAREARDGQKSDSVYVDVIKAIPYHDEVLTRVLREARATSEATGFVHRLVAADWV